MSAIGTAKARELSSLANSRGAATAQCRCSVAFWHCRLAAARFGMFAASSGAPCHGTPQGSELWPVGFNGAITAGIRDRRNGVRGSVCSAAILSRSCPPWVKSGHQRTLRPCSLYPQKRTLIERLRMSGRPVSGRHKLYRSSREQDGYLSIFQNVSGCPAKDHLSQSALRVGAFNQKVAARRLGCR